MFISTIESKKYPFFGIQFHPEKNLYEWNGKSAIEHSFHAVKASQYFANMFIEESRKSIHGYSEYKLLQKDLIWNYRVVHTGLIPGSNYEQIYFFTKDDIKGDSEYSNKIPQEVSDIS